MLITGGLIVLGVLILVAAFFIGRGDDASSQANRSDPAPTRTTPSRAAQQAPADSTAPLTVAERAPETQPALMNGQLHEMAGQLQKLQEQSQELGRRLELLNTMVRRIEQGESASADK
jgi:TolA-binding protein